METLERMPFKARKSVFEKLEKIVDIASLSKKERLEYDESIKVYRDHLVTISFAENQGMEIGRKEGMKEGMEKGKKEGIEEGMKKKGLEMARNLKELGLPVATISQVSGLSIDEIERI